MIFLKKINLNIYTNKIINYYTIILLISNILQIRIIVNKYNLYYLNNKDVYFLN